MLNSLEDGSTYSVWQYDEENVKTCEQVHNETNVGFTCIEG